MCGIAGIVSLNGAPIKNSFNRVSLMNKLLNHRGPDGNGVYVSPDNTVVLGNTRLAITDPNKSFELPMRSEDSNKVITFNGEIYDYIEKKEFFKSKGVNFKTDTDTEVLLNGLSILGENFLNDLDGMWAIAYFDVSQKSVLLSRDLMGERHIFYRFDEKEFIFASEPLPILADKSEPESIDIISMVSSLRFGVGLPGHTLVKGINRMLPGQNIKINIGQGWKQYPYRKLNPEKWFDFFNKDPSYEEAIDPFTEIMNKVSSRRLPKDVSYISTLSGGIDSTLVSLFASEFGNKKLNTLYGQSGPKHGRNKPSDLDEYQASLFTSSKINSKHNHVKMNSEECIPYYQNFSSNGFDGMVDPTVTAFEMLARETSSLGLKVILISDGPDEYAGGYQSDLYNFRLDNFRQKRPLFFSYVKRLSNSRLGRKFLKGLSLNSSIIPAGVNYKPFRFNPLHEQLSPLALYKLFDPEIVDSTHQFYSGFPERYKDIEKYLDYTQKSALSYASYVTPDFTNLKSDKGFLPASVESRSPLLAPDLVDFLIAMPAKFRFGKGNETKSFLRYIVDKYVGPEIGRRSKHGFSQPLHKTPIVRSYLKIDEIISETKLFKDLPFKKNVKDQLKNSNMNKCIWPLFVIASTYEKMRKGNY